MYRMLQYVCCCLCTASLQAAWTPPEPISDTGQNVFDLQIAVNAAGNASAAWIIYDGTENVVQAKTKPVDGIWQDLATLSGLGLNANMPQIAVDAAGNATAVWAGYDGSYYII